MSAHPNAAAVDAGKLNISNFLLALADAVECSGLSSVEATRLFERLKQIKCVTISAVAHWDGGSLRAEAVNRPNAIMIFKTLLIGQGQGTAPADSPELMITLSDLLDSCATHHKSAQALKNKKEEDATDDEAARDGYEKLLRYQGRTVPLDQRINGATLGRFCKDINRHNYIESVPRISSVRYSCKTGAMREANLGSLGDSALRISLSGDSGSDACSIPQVHFNIRSLLFGICAAMSRTITTSAFGGGPAGVVSVPGEKRSVRVQLCIVKTDQFIWRLCQASSVFGTDLVGYCRMVDNAIFEFVKKCEPCTMHPSDVVDHLLTSMPNLFRPGTEEDAQSAASTGPPAADAAPAAGGQGLCSNWLQNGNCRKYNDGLCPNTHPSAMQNALHGGGGRDRAPRAQPYPQNTRNRGQWGGGGGGNSNNSPYVPSYYDNGAQAWNTGHWGGGGGGGWNTGGGGKGGGGKGAGKGGGKGKGKGKGGKGKQQRNWY